MGISRQNYYARRKARQRRRVDADLVAVLVVEERKLQPRLGTRKLHFMLKGKLVKEGVELGRDRFFEVLRGHGLLVERRVRSARTTNSRHGFRVYENLLAQAELTGPHQAWVSDITYIPTWEGWLYLATVQDLFSRKIVGWSMQPRMTRQLVIDALEMAVDRHRPEPGLLCHSDRGSQYASDDYQAVLARHGMVCSMSRKGNCWDNAVMESFYSTLKTELIYHETFRTRDEARRAVFEYIEMFYNGIRRHSTLGYLSPIDFELAA